MNIPVFVYSSGSIAAQKLIFGYSEQGDLLKFFKGHFDTGIGSKLETTSYEKISESIGLDASSILFLSDNFHEIKAAKIAKYQVAITSRPGNAPLTPEPKENALDTLIYTFLDLGITVPVVKSFVEIFERSEFLSSPPTANETLSTAVTTVEYKEPQQKRPRVDNDTLTSSPTKQVNDENGTTSNGHGHADRDVMVSSDGVPSMASTTTTEEVTLAKSRASEKKKRGKKSVSATPTTPARMTRSRSKMEK